jgi:hypothetical protein
MNLVELKKMSITELTKLAKELNIEGASGMKKQNLPSDNWIVRFYEWALAEGITTNN